MIEKPQMLSEIADDKQIFLVEKYVKNNHIENGEKIEAVLLDNSKLILIIRESYNFKLKYLKFRNIKMAKETKIHPFRKEPLGTMFNVITGRSIKYSKPSISKIKEKLVSLKKDSTITSAKFNLLCKQYAKKIIEEERHKCNNKGMLWCDETNECVKDTTENRLKCGFLLTEEQVDELTKEKEPKTRKNPDYQFTEFLFAVVLKNPDMEFDIPKIKNIDNINVHKSSVSLYIADLESSVKTRSNKASVKRWFDNAKKSIKSLYETYPETLNQDEIEVYVTGKKSTFKQISSRQDKTKGSDKINKGDVYLISGKNFIGFSIKKSKIDTYTNWSIETMIKDINTTQYEDLKETKTKFISELGIELMSSSKFEKSNKSLKTEVRNKFNKAMRGDNIYKKKIDQLVKRNSNYFLSELIKGISCNTSYPTYFFNGTEFYNLNSVYDIYKEKLDKNQLGFLNDNKKDNSNLNRLKLKEHYSPNAGKLWYYLKEGKNEVNYRFEIRVKGNLFASLQFFTHKI